MTYSETVNYLQGDEKKAAELLVQIANEQEKALLRIKEAQKELQNANNHYSSTMIAIENVCKHLQKDPDFHITKDKKNYHITPGFQVQISDIDWEL